MEWKKIMWAKKPDGGRKMGLGMYIIVFGLPFLILVFMLRGGQKINRLKSAGVSLSQTSQAVRSTETVEVTAEAKEIKSDRAITAVKGTTEVGKTSNTENNAEKKANNALDLAAREVNADKERPAIPDVDALPGSNAQKGGNRRAQPEDSNPFSTGMIQYGNAPGGSTMGGGAMSPGSFDQQPLDTPNLDQLEYHRPADKKTELSKTDPQKSTTGQNQEGSSGNSVNSAKFYAAENYLPRGQEIELWLLDTVRTDQPQPLITLGVAKDVRFGEDGPVVIPFGTRLLASCQGNPDKGSRIIIDATSLQFLDGSEVPVAGIIKYEDGAQGVPAYYIPPPTWVQMSSYVNDFIAGYLDLIYLKQQSNLGLQIGTVGISATQPTFSAKNEALSATSEVIKTFASKQMEEVQSRYPAYLIAPPGMKVKLQLTEQFSLVNRGHGVAALKPIKIVDTESQSGGLNLPPNIKDALKAVQKVSEQTANNAIATP